MKGPKKYSKYWSHVQRQEGDGCWLWTGTITRKGYGSYSGEGAHRLGWMFANGPIPQGRLVLHKCDVRNCVNPSHLFVGSAAQNSRDMVIKGRAPNSFKNTTHCKHGHAYADHGYVDQVTSWRQCKLCHTIGARNHYAKKLIREGKPHIPRPRARARIDALVAPAEGRS